MDNPEILRSATEDVVNAALGASDLNLPLGSASSVAQVISHMIGGPVLLEEVQRALAPGEEDQPFVALPIADAAAFLEVYNIVLNQRFGEDE